MYIGDIVLPNISEASLDIAIESCDVLGVNWYWGVSDKDSNPLPTIGLSL